MEQIATLEVILVITINFLFYFVIAASGALVKDIYDNVVSDKKKIEFPRILIASIVTVFMCIGLQEYLSENFSINIIILICFLGGVVGFELFGHINSFESMKQFIEDLLRIKEIFNKKE